MVWDNRLAYRIGKLLLLLGDVALVGLSYIVLLLSKFDNRIPSEIWLAGVYMICISCTSFISVSIIYNQYRDLHRPFIDIAAGATISVVIASALSTAGAYLLPAMDVPRAIIVAAVPFQILLVITWRIPFVRFVKRQYFAKKVTLVTSMGEFELSDTISLPSYIQIGEVVNPQDFLREELPLGKARTQMLFIASDVHGDDRHRLLEWATENNVDTYIIPDLFELLVKHGSFVRLGDTPVLAVRHLGIPLEYRIVKRGIDVLCSIALSAVFAPLFLVVPIANRLLSPGPTFFRQERVGENGGVFKVLKFRSMIPDAEKETGAVLASNNDSRVTSVGRILRATRLDEVPQILNVLKGDMSLVGPRPERPVFVEQFNHDNSHFSLRELAKPGITGLAQVMGRYDTDPNNKLRFDLLYIVSYSPWLDIRILIWTVQTVLFPQKWVESPPAWVNRLENGVLSSGKETA